MSTSSAVSPVAYRSDDVGLATPLLSEKSGNQPPATGNYVTDPAAITAFTKMFDDGFIETTEIQ
jgi:hypothetical protein